MFQRQWAQRPYYFWNTVAIVMGKTLTLLVTKHGLLLLTHILSGKSIHIWCQSMVTASVSTTFTCVHWGKPDSTIYSWGNQQQCIVLFDRRFSTLLVDYSGARDETGREYHDAQSWDWNFSKRLRWTARGGPRLNEIGLSRALEYQ